MKQSSDVEKLNGVMGYIFFPKGTPDEDKTLEYHKKHYHKKILVNNRRIPPQAYTLPAAKTCFGWRLINKYPDLWTSVEDTTFPDENVREWCKEQGYTFHPWSATKTELVEGYTSLDRELLDKLKKCRKEGKLDNYRIIFLAKWYQLRTKDYLPYRVLQQYKPPRIYDAPLNTIELIQSGLLDRTTKLKLPFQNLRRWTKWRHYGEYMDRCFTERHLAGEAEVTKP